ncbi:hypothetical protein SAMN05444280_11278 [Tangfeifania diversioriginum]|uniref:Uncharacterized protein n=1 Tax=Tangfeifania diversioriginum TaxID=1168035 RepID=A0A1M6H4E9_9BACT|nr:hypothetical protein [Tangfeifania diversioriginum]SHJ17016.1 hypothetical protein SAMN05444280_11278 [Tangfeifania diversioriginum]
MIVDYLKIHDLPVPADEILNNDRLTFPLSNVATTGEMMNRAQVAHWKELKFVVKGEKVSMKGSPHKHKEGGSNYRDFYLNDVKETIEKLAETFQFDEHRAFINFIEVGVNIPLNDDPSKLIKTLVIYRNNPFTPLHVQGKGFGRKCETQRFTIKVYNKSLQYGLPYHLLRFEVKIHRMRYLKEKYNLTGLTLADLKDPATYVPLKKMLLDVWNGILLFNPATKPESITNPKDRQLFIEGRYPEFWQGLNKYQRTRKKKRFIELAEGGEISKQIAELIEKKCNLLTTFKPEPLKKKMQPSNHFAETAKNEKMQPSNTTINSYLVAHCIVTGLEIKHPSPSKKYLTQTDIKWYFENEYGNYQKKLESLLTKKWKTRNQCEPLEAWFSEIAHKIRCKLSNPRRNPENNTWNSYENVEGKGLKLWPTEQLADPEKLELIKNRLSVNNKNYQKYGT